MLQGLLLLGLLWAMALPVSAAVPAASNARFPYAVAGVSGKLTATDADNDALTFSLVAQSSRGTVTITAATGDFTYVPTVGVSGTDTFTFKVNDGTADSNVATVRILPAISVSVGSSVLIEGQSAQSNSAPITFIRTGELDPIATEDILVSYEITGTATQGGNADFDLSIGQVRFSRNSNSVTVGGTLNVGTDQDIEPDETIIITVKDGDNYMAAPAGAGSVTVIIQDPAATMPKANFQLDQMVGEGGEVVVRVVLDAAPSSYPVKIPFTLSGTAAAGIDYETSTPSPIVITSGTRGEVTLTAKADTLDEPTDETVVFNMGQPFNARSGSFRTQTVTITEKNIPAAVSLTARQNTVPTRVVMTDGGLVTVSVDVRDINGGDLSAYQYDWSATNPALTSGSQGNVFIFNPSTLGLGYYKVRVKVTDGSLAPQSTQAELQLRVIQTRPLFTDGDSDFDGVPDRDEAVGDSDNDGIQDYYDSSRLAANFLQQKTPRADAFLMQTRADLSLRLGDTALATGRDQALVSAEDIISLGGGEGRTGPNATDSRVNSGGFNDFEIHGLPAPGISVSVVIPQTAAIPKDAVYRKYSTASGWRDFVRNSLNQVFSAAGREGVCPPPGDSAYAAGLTEGHLCVQLTIQEGGPNDGDGVANFIIKDPGGVVISVDSGTETPVRGACGNLFCSQGGSGALGWDSVLSLLICALAGVANRRRKTA
ncbi:MAG: Ig-like domain-containing protein [Pseudomonadota bacterium]